MKIKLSKIIDIAIVLYLTVLTSFQLGFGIDVIIKKISFVFLIFSFVLYSKKFSISKSTKCLLIFWLFYFLSILWCKNINDTFMYFNNFVYIIVISIVLSNRIREKNDAIVVLKELIISLLISTIILLIRTPYTDWGTVRIGEALGIHPNTLGVRMAFASIISLFFVHKSYSEKNKKKMFFYSFCVVLFGIISLYSQSKKSVLLLIVGIGVFEIVSTKGLKVLLKTIFIIILCLLFVYVLLNNNYLYSIIGYRIQDFISSLNGVSATVTGDISTYERRFYIVHAIRLFRSNIIVGYGGNNFITYMREIGYIHIAYSHNNYTEILCTLGLFGFFLYYIFWFKSLFYYRLIISNNKNNLLIYCLFFTIIICKLVADFALVSYIDEFISILFICAISYLDLCDIRERKYE